MPHINSIRLANVHFNNATQFYDDFRMDLWGKNSTYDLENGGGKSLLLLMVLQTVMPKVYLRREKPLSLIFQGGKDRTSHVAVEWSLEEGSGYKYLLTGFSARKRRGSSEPTRTERTDDDEVLQASDVEHISWCIFYNDHKTTGIRTVPLAMHEENGKNSYASFEDIRRYIQQLRQKGLPAEVFDRIDKYQSYIAANHLLAAEWNIIKGINSGENNIESYFRQNATSRKLIENQFIKIIEDVEALNRGGTSQDDSLLLADTLIDIRNRLNEYLKLKGHMSEYTKIKEYFLEFGNRNQEFQRIYTDFEDCMLQAVQVNNLIASNLQVLDQRRIATNSKLEDSTNGLSEAQQLQKLLEAGLVEYERGILLAKRSRLEQERDGFVVQQDEISQELNHLKTLEGYEEYRQVKAKISGLLRQLQTLQMDGDALEGDYREIGGKLHFLIDKLYAEHSATQQQLTVYKQQYADLSETHSQDLIAAEKQSSILGEKIQNLADKQDSLDKQLAVVNDFFFQTGDRHAVLLPQQQMSSWESERKTYLMEKESHTERITGLEQDLQNSDLAIERVKGEIKTKEATKKPIETWLIEYQQELNRLKDRARSLGKDTVEDYHQELGLNLHRESLRKLEKEIEAGRKRQKKQLSEDRGYYVPNEEILALADQLSAKCEYVQTGIDWIAQMDGEERAHTIGAMPYLAFSVIVDSKAYTKLKNGLKLDFSSDYPVPIINLDSIRRKDVSLVDDIYYFCSFAGLLLDYGRYEQYIQSIDSELANIAGDIKTADTRISECSRDLAGVDAFFAKFSPAELAIKQTSITQIDEETARLKQDLVKRIDDRQKMLTEKNHLTLNVQELSSQINQLDGKLEKLTQAIEISEQQAKISSDLALRKKEQAAVETEIQAIKTNASQTKQKLDDVVEQLRGLEFLLYQLKQERAQLPSFSRVETDQPIDEVREQFKALDEALGGKNKEEKELRTDLQAEEIRCTKIRERISRDYGGDLAEIEAKERAGVGITIPTESSINETKRRLVTVEAQLKMVVEEVNQNSKEIHSMEGRLGEILKAAKADEDTDLPQYDTEIRYQQEINQAKQLIHSYEEEIAKAETVLDAMQEELHKLTREKDSYEAFIEREEIPNDGQIAIEVVDYRLFEKDYHRLQEQIRQLCDKWDHRMKAIQVETSQYIIREPLEELDRISKPSSAAQCQARIESFAEYIANIEECMNKILSDIQQLEHYQEDFTRRCIQKAELVLGHLHKIESLSRIEVYGRRTSMIELRLPEFDETDKTLRVKAHIDGIVKSIEAEGTIDRKRVAAKFATKELLAQIVDMDKAAVRLYKIETIPENSRFYRWESAIGSEGQNNSLYFIFAACLISFTRMLSITNTSIRAKKVVIADNPFGATSAVYLWDPMFKIMAQNDIQLIAPGHRVPREITSRFGVNYLLNQDVLQDGRMRVVVKDVRTEEDESVIRYVDSEQLSLY